MSEDDKLHIARTVNKMVAKTLQAYLGGLLVLIVLIFGWHQIAIDNVTKRITEAETKTGEVTRDFGEVNQTLRKFYPDELVFESNYIKYVIKRGARQ